MSPSRRLPQIEHPDPLFRAVVNGDIQVPDGKALARLGQRVRQAATPPQPVDLRDRVLAAVRQLPASSPSAASAEPAAQEVDEPTSSDADASAVDDALIDAWYNGDRAGAVAGDPLLERLGDLVRRAASPPREPDLLPRVLNHLARHHSSRRQAVTLDQVSRWRIWTAVVAGHAAAFMALAAIHVSVGRSLDPPSPEMVESRMRERPGFHRIHPARMVVDPLRGSIEEWGLPSTWDDLRQEPLRLFALRLDAEQRNLARNAFASQQSAALIEGCGQWLLSQQNDDGSIGPMAPRQDEQIVVQAAVAYALLGEGLDHPERLAAVQRLLPWLMDQLAEHGEQLDSRSLGLATLALIEGALLLDDALLAGQIEQWLERHGHRLDEAMGRGGLEGGLGGFALVAVELATLGGLRLPEGLRLAVENRVARPLPSAAADPGRLGVAAFARQIKGAGHALSTTRQLDQLMDWLPGTASGQRLDLIAWYFPTLALRETRDRRWVAWNRALESTLLAAAHHGDGGMAWIPRRSMRYAEPFAAAGDVAATAFAMMSLQAAYRYLPVHY